MTRFFTNADIRKAQTIDKQFYTHTDIFEQSKEKIFANSWQYIGHADLIKSTGDVYPFILLEQFIDEPLLLVRKHNEDLQLLSNVCTHRANIVAEKPCNLNHLRCRYHGRKFSLEGKLISMPEFKEVENFPCESDHLSQLPIHDWKNFLFTNLNNELNFNEVFNDMISRVSWMPIEGFQFAPQLTKEYHVKSHWALYCENYLEGFHIPFVHADLNAEINYGEYMTELYYPYSSLQIGYSKTPENCFELPEESIDFGKNIAAYYFWIFPNTMFNFYPWGLSINVVQPISINESKVTFYSYIWDESKLRQGAGSDLDKVEKEDEAIVENVQRGVQSRFYKHGRYSATREQGTHHFHKIISEFLKNS